MKKIYKKKIIVSLFVALLLMGSTQAYAASQNTNIISLIKDGFKTITAYFIQTSDQEVSNMKTDNANDIKQYIETTSNQAITDIEKHKNSEVVRAGQEIDTYVNELKNQMDTVVNDEKNKLKQQITDKINEDVTTIKTDLDKEMEKYIKQLLKK